MGVHQKAILSDSLESGWSRVIGNRCKGWRSKERVNLKGAFIFQGKTLELKS